MKFSRYLTPCIIFVSVSVGMDSYTFSITKKESNIEYLFSGMFKPETFYGRNIGLLNECNKTDRIFFARHILDLNLDVLCGKKEYDRNVAELFFSARNKAVWGNPSSIAQTTEAEFKISETVLGKHKHFIPRHIFWIREVWLDLDLNKVLGLNFTLDHRFIIGAFKFEFGRGIALGSAYAVGPEVLGFYSDDAVDQYAFGAKLSGGIVKERLFYDLYGAILHNKSSSLSETTAKILGQEYGKLRLPYRGFGKINYLFAGRLNWFPLNHSQLGTLKIEPYWVFNKDPEQKVEFLGDAESRLGTLGIACEYETDKFVCGFDYALNLGNQKVKGWDRNHIAVANRNWDVADKNGVLVEVNSHVLDAKPPGGNKVLYVPGSNNQNIIASSVQDESRNGQAIGGGLFNASDRFRNPYKNSYEGWMFVADAAWWLFNKDLQLATTVGIASGDENPNEEAKDGVYSGFIGLQELYSGKRVRSAFLLGSSGKLKRPLSIPLSEQPTGKFARTVSGFTNLAFIGCGIRWEPHDREDMLVVHPNALVYWQDHPTREFDLKTKKSTNKLASNFLGIELNAFMDYNIFDCLKIFGVFSFFLAGSHYDDVKGIPLDADQVKALDRYDRTGFLNEIVPTLGNDSAFTFNIGLEYNF